MLRASRTWVHLRIGSYFQKEMIAGFITNELHQIAGVAELAFRTVDAGHVAPQCDQSFDAHVHQRFKLSPNRRPGRANA